MPLAPALTFKNLTLPPFKSNKKTLSVSLGIGLENQLQLAVLYIVIGPCSFVPHPYEWFTETHQVAFKERNTMSTITRPRTSVKPVLFIIFGQLGIQK